MEGDEGREMFKKVRRWRGMREGRCLKRKGDGGDEGREMFKKERRWRGRGKGDV